MGGYLEYPEYKDSGINWLGKIPAHWELKRLHHIARLRSGETMTADMMDENAEFPVYGGNGLRGYFDSYTHEGDYVLIGRQGALCGNINYATGKFWASEHAVVVSPTIELETFWLGELLRTMNLNQYSTSAAQPGISVEMIGRLKLPFPSLSEQESIARFLDYKIAQIDALIAKKENLLAKLAEKRTALISQAVTKGLDPTVPMKDSGIEWLGDIPTHWGAVKIRYCSEFVTSGSRGWSQYFSDDGSVFLRITNVSRDGIELKLDDVQRVTPPIGAEGERAKVLPGDVIVSITADLGSVAVVPENFEIAHVSQHLALIRPTLQKTYGRWIAYQIFAHAGKTQLVSSGYGGTKIQLNLTDIKDLWIALPPKSEQQEIENALKNQVANVDQMETRIRQAIAKLKEYRTALITNAVTGKIDVRDVKLPEADWLEAS